MALVSALFPLNGLTACYRTIMTLLYSCQTIHNLDLSFKFVPGIQLFKFCVTFSPQGICPDQLRPGLVRWQTGILSSLSLSVTVNSKVSFLDSFALACYCVSLNLANKQMRRRRLPPVSGLWTPWAPDPQCLFGLPSGSKVFRSFPDSMDTWRLVSCSGRFPPSLISFYSSLHLLVRMGPDTSQRLLPPVLKMRSALGAPFGCW